MAASISIICGLPDFTSAMRGGYRQQVLGTAAGYMWKKNEGDSRELQKTMSDIW